MPLPSIVDRDGASASLEADDNDDDGSKSRRLTTSRTAHASRRVASRPHDFPLESAPLAVRRAAALCHRFRIQCQCSPAFPGAPSPPQKPTAAGPVGRTCRVWAKAKRRDAETQRRRDALTGSAWHTVAPTTDDRRAADHRIRHATSRAIPVD